jgi:hypothetical protein
VCFNCTMPSQQGPWLDAYDTKKTSAGVECGQNWGQSVPRMIYSTMEFLIPSTRMIINFADASLDMVSSACA